jgi:biotin carboxyl carrier protein
MIYRPGETGALDLDPPRNPLDDLPRLVAEIVETMRRGNMAEIEIVRGDFRLAMRSFPPAQQGTGSRMTDAFTPSTDEETESQASNVHVVTSPMIGTFYAAPAPGEPPFVLPGDHVVEDQVIGIVEAMKIMNEISTDRAGTVLEVIAENGQTV